MTHIIPLGNMRKSLYGGLRALFFRGNFFEIFYRGGERMNKAQRITLATTAILIAFVFLLWWEVDYYVASVKNLMFFMGFLGLGIFILLGLKKRK